MIRAFVLAVIVAALSGCALLRPRSVETPPHSPASLAAWNVRVVQLQKLSRFTVQGRVASGALGFKADLRWKQYENGRFEMRLAGPFGAGAAELSGDARRVQVRTGEDETITTADPEAWLEQQLGVRLPVTGLRWWALGLPEPNAKHQVVLDTSGRALRIVQNGWELNYPEYRVEPPLDLPRRIEAVNGDTRVLLLADAWSGFAPSPLIPNR
ncbi:MAG: lipoprotein insertase outer membrane protein LolB [Panacagrimonas sp.]